MTEDTKRYSCAEMGTAMFAFLNIVVVSITLLGCLMSIPVLYSNESPNTTDKDDAFLWCMCFGTNLLVLIVFVFAVLLYLGMYQRKPNYLLAYIIFGVIVELTLMTSLVASRYVSINEDFKDTLGQAFGEIYKPATYAILGICVIHTLLLCMVCRAWFLMWSKDSVNHKKLVNESD